MWLLATRASAEERGICSIRAAISYPGVMDMAAWHHELAHLESRTAVDFMGAAPADDPDAYRAAAPLHHVHERVPPMLLIHVTEPKEFVREAEVLRFLRAHLYGVLCVRAVSPGRSRRR